MALPRLFLTRVVSGVALHATVTVRAGRRAWAGSGESPCCESGPAVIVNTSAAVTALISRPIFLIPIHLSCSGGGKEGCQTLALLRNEGSILLTEGDVCAPWYKTPQGTKEAPNFRELRACELRRMHLLRAS